MTEERIQYEEFKLTGDQVLTKIRELLREGGIRRIIIKNEEGRTLIEIPLLLGMVSVLLLPVWAAVGAVAALATSCTIVVEKVEGKAAEEPPPPPAPPVN
ncbi:MAG: DUF4342 domain-containing protein [bacterium]